MRGSVKCFAQVQADDSSCSSLVHQRSNPISEGHRVYQAQFALREATLAVTNHLSVFHVPQRSFQEDLLQDLARHTLSPEHCSWSVPRTALRSALRCCSGAGSPQAFPVSREELSKTRRCESGNPALTELPSSASSKPAAPTPPGSEHPSHAAGGTGRSRQPSAAALDKYRQVSAQVFAAGCGDGVRPRFGHPGKQQVSVAVPEGTLGTQCDPGAMVAPASLPLLSFQPER